MLCIASSVEIEFDFKDLYNSSAALYPSTLGELQVHEPLKAEPVATSGFV